MGLRRRHNDIQLHIRVVVTGPRDTQTTTDDELLERMLTDIDDILSKNVIYTDYRFHVEDRADGTLGSLRFDGVQVDISAGPPYYGQREVFAEQLTENLSTLHGYESADVQFRN